MNNQQTKELAESMGVSVSDLMCFSRLTANGIEDEGVVSLFLSNDNIRELSLSYANCAIQRMDLFIMRLQKNEDAARLFKDKVLADIQEKQAIIGVIDKTEKYLNGEK